MYLINQEIIHNKKMHLIKIPMIKKFSGQSNLLHFSTTLHSRFLSEILCIFVGRLGPGSCLQHIISTLLQLTGYLGELKSRLLTWRRRGADAEAWIRADTVYYDDSVDIKFIWVRVTCCPDNNDMSNLAMSETIRCVLVVSKPLLQMFQSLHLHHVPCLQLR